MNYEVIFRPKAEGHIKEIYDWYELKREGLGEEFLLTFEATIMLIERNPLTFAIKHKKFRCVLTPRFPYGIFYFIDEKTIVVVAVLHLSRNPKNWKE